MMTMTKERPTTRLTGTMMVRTGGVEQGTADNDDQNMGMMTMRGTAAGQGQRGEVMMTTNKPLPPSHKMWGWGAVFSSLVLLPRIS